MIKNSVKILLFILFTFFVSVGYCQKRPSSGFTPGNETDKPFVPDNPVKVEQEKKEEDKKKENPTGPMTDKERRQKMREDERTKKRTYDAHHDRIQEKAVRKRMKKNEKKSKNINTHKKPSIFKKIFLNEQKKKRRKG